jgi:hypothetical protein
MRYFLHIHSPEGRQPDEEGQDHPDLAAARRAAVAGLREIVSHGLLVGELRLDEWIQIEEAGGIILDRVRIADILDTPPRRGSVMGRRSANDR